MNFCIFSAFNSSFSAVKGKIQQIEWSFLWLVPLRTSSQDAQVRTSSSGGLRQKKKDSEGSPSELVLFITCSLNGLRGERKAKLNLIKNVKFMHWKEEEEKLRSLPENDSRESNQKICSFFFGEKFLISNLVLFRVFIRHQRRYTESCSSSFVL